LIALRINNWNQNRITKLKEKKALIQLVQNLNSNLKQFSYNIKIENDIIKSVEILIDYVGNKKPYVSSLAIHAEKTIWMEQMTINNSTYEGLKAANFDVIGSDALKNEIIELFEVNYTNNKELINDVATASATSLTLPMALKYEIFNAVNYKKALNDFEYLNFLYVRKRWKRDVILKNKRLIPLTQKLIEVIEKELNTMD